METHPLVATLLPGQLGGEIAGGKDIVVNCAKLGREGCKDVIAAAYRYKLAQLEG